MDENNCLFCRLVKGIIPAHIVFEDDNFLGFMDIKPLNPGNTLLIPKKHYRWVSDVPDIGDFFTVANKIGKATLPLVGADYLSFLTLGMEIPHAHIRIIPRFLNDQHTHGIDTNLVINQSPSQLQTLAQKISNSIKK